MLQKLTQVGIESRRKRGLNKLYSDAGARGLYLKTTKADTASWIFRWRDRATKKLRDMGLGTVHEISLAAARDKANDLRKLVYLGIDPISERERALNEMRAATATQMTFAQCTETYIDSLSPSWGNEKHRQQWENTLKSYAYPLIGSLPASEILLAHVVKVLKPIWTTKTETATRVRGRIESILDWATVSGFRSGDNPARWKGNLDKILPKPSKLKNVVHHPALPWQEIQSFMAKLKLRNGMSARALEFAILTAARSGEVRFMTWDEIDSDSNMWTIPAARMKSRRAHRVPLNSAAIKLLD